MMGKDPVEQGSAFSIIGVGAPDGSGTMSVYINGR